MMLIIIRVLNGGLWSFDKNMSIFGVIEEGKDPTTIPLFYVPFLIQMHNLPVEFMSQKVEESLRNYTIQFLEYDEKNNVNFLCLFMRIKVLLNIQKPLTYKNQETTRRSWRGLNQIWMSNIYILLLLWNFKSVANSDKGGHNNVDNNFHRICN